MFALALASSLGRAGAHDENIHAGVEFQVNGLTTGNQISTSAAMDADGDFVVVWQNIRDAVITIFGRRYSRTGDAIAGEFQISDYTTEAASRPWVAAEPGGDFVVVWEQSNRDDYGYGVFARRYSTTGGAIGLDFQVNQMTAGSQRFPKVAADADGDFVTVWESQNIVGRRFSSSGTPLGGDFLINELSTMGGSEPAIAMDADGDFVVVWSNFFGAFGRRFSSAGAPLTADFQINTFTVGGGLEAEVAAETNGDFVVVWESMHDGYDRGIFARRFSSTGAAMGSDFQVNTRTQGQERFPSVTSDADGDFVVTWGSYGQDGSSGGVFAQRYSSAGARVGAEFQVNSYTTGGQGQPAIASDADGDFIVAWLDSSRDGEVSGVFAQLFDDPILADVDGNGVADPLTDGVLLLRYLFGFRGLTLVSGAVDLLGCKRCNVPMIEGYLFEITN
jgi:hypothetical protein